MVFSTPTWASFGTKPLLYCLLLGGLLTTPEVAWAQERAGVSGTVAGPGGTPIELATVTLHRAADSIAVKTEFSDAQGTFRLVAPAGGRYRVSAAQLGFERGWSPVFELPTGGLALPALQLPRSLATALKEVTVTARRPQFEHRADRTIVNVADSPLSAGATALDVLGRSPGITVDAGDNLGLRGRQGLLVVIDGKRVPLKGTELADYLKTLPAEQLQSIELITNPPAQYDAQGGAGVIAINLKKDQRLGTNGSINASYGRGEYGKFTGGLALNHRRNNLNAYGTYAYIDRRGFVRLDFNRQFVATPLLPAARSAQANEQLSQLRSHSAKLGLDLTLSKRTLLGASLNALASQTDNRTENQTLLYDDADVLTDRYRSSTLQGIARPNGSANLNLRHSFADSANARVLSADADYASYRTQRVINLNTYFDSPAKSADLLTSTQLSNLTIGTVKTDFIQPLPHRARMEAGAKVTAVTTDNDVQFVNVVNGAGVLNPMLSTRFVYHENINAAYINLRSSPTKTLVQVGLRVEQAHTRTETGSALHDRRSTQLFPNASVERTFSAQHALVLSVARRIDRPAYGQVNPLRAYVDATSYRAGNPDLVAQTSYNLELTHTYRQKFSTAFAYTRTDRPIVNVVQPSPDGGRVVVNRDVNLATQHFYTLTLTAPLELTKWWTMYTNGLFYYNLFQGTLAGTVLNRGRFAYNLTVNGSFILPHGWTADLSSLYESREVYGFEAIHPRGQVAAGVQKSLWNKQGTFRLNIADVFYTTPIHSTSTYDNFTESFTSRQDTRVVTAALLYRFGNTKLAAARKRAAGADEELRRAAGQ
ncbi:MAG: outer membrane beta-barrel family protein [Hymenobacter sp.]